MGRNRPLAEAVGLEPTRGVNPTDFRDRLLSQLGYASVLVIDYIMGCSAVNMVNLCNVKISIKSKPFPVRNTKVTQKLSSRYYL